MYFGKFRLVPAALALLGSLTVTASQARGAEVQWSVTIGAPVVTLPAPVLRMPLPVPVVVMPAPRSQAVVVSEHSRPDPYREPTRWDVDGDGIPNRYDRLYNPVWDRNGNGVPDRREHRHFRHGDHDHGGVPDRYDRYDDRYGRGRPGERRGPR